MSRTVGLIAIVVSIGICLIGGLFLGSQAVAGSLSTGGAIIGGGLLLLIGVAPPAVFGIIAIMRNRSEESSQEEAEDLRKILDMVKARGEVDISDVIIELDSGLPAVQDMLYRLVGMGLFNGYINWDAGMLYSEEASALHELTNCRHCNGEVSFAGKGVLQCPYCGTEYFLSQ